MVGIAAARRGGNEVHLGKTESGTMVNPDGISYATSRVSQDLREHHSANSSRDILKATGGSEGIERGRNT